MNVDGEVSLRPGISIPSTRSTFCMIGTRKIANPSRSQFLGILVMSFESRFVIAESEPLQSSLVGTVYRLTNGAVSTKDCDGRKGEICDLRGTRDREQKEWCVSDYVNSASNA